MEYGGGIATITTKAPKYWIFSIKVCSYCFFILLSVEVAPSSQAIHRSFPTRKKNFSKFFFTFFFSIFSLFFACRPENFLVFIGSLYKLGRFFFFLEPFPSRIAELSFDSCSTSFKIFFFFELGFSFPFIYIIWNKIFFNSLEF